MGKAKTKSATKTVRFGRVKIDRSVVTNPDGSTTCNIAPGWSWVLGMVMAGLGPRPTRRRKDEALEVLRDAGMPDELAGPIVEGTATWEPDGDAVLVTLPA